MSEDTQRHLRLLSLDGGGIRGLSSFVILQQIMNGVNQDRGPDDQLHPWQVFDMIGGTSTGGIIAIMLGRLRMTLDECEDAYLKLSKRIFQPKRRFGTPLKVADYLQANGRFDAHKLEEVIKDSIRATKIDDVALHEDALLKDEDPRCKVFVCATRANNSEPALLRSYQNPKMAPVLFNECKIWEACRATSAATTFFDPVTIGKYGQTFVDGAVVYSNPVQLVQREASQLWPSRKAMMISVGTGAAPTKSFDGSLLAIVNSMKSILTQTERTANDFYHANQEMATDKRLFRFNVTRGLEGIGLAEYKEIGAIVDATQSYLNQAETCEKLSTCIEKLTKSNDESQHENDPLYLLNQQRIETERRPLAEWLSPLNFFTKQIDVFSLRTEGTGQWLLDSPEFQRWLAGDERTLWCFGIPGAGKTVLASMVVDHLRSKFADKDDVGVSFAYCSHQERTKQTPVTLIGSLLKQLVQERPALCELVMPLYKNHRKYNTSPTLPEVSKALQKITAQYKRVFVVVDALDECQEDYGFRDHLLEELGSLDSQVSLLLTSRPHISVEYDFESAVPIEIRASEVDLRKYLEQRLARATRLVRYVRPDPELKTAIIETLLGNARGMFLLAQLHMDLVVAKATQNEIRKALENLPQGLDESYRDALRRIESQNHDDCQRAKRTIYWISHVLRPLTVTEMQSALAVVPKTKRLDHGDIIHHDILLSICAGLIVIDSESNHFRLVHYTAQKYFEGVRAELFPDAQADIAGTCITYLSYDVFAEGPCPSKELFEARLNANALLDYAAENWGKHLRGKPEEQSHLQEQALGFLDDDITTSAAVQVAYVNRYGSKERPEVFSTGVRPLQLAASFGLSRIVKFLVERGDDVQSADSEGTTALHEAAAFGDDGILKLLLEHGADVAASTKDGATSLCNAIVGGNDSSALLLLDVGSDLEAKDPYEGTVIHSAAYNRDLKALELLLSRGANVSAIDSHGNTPLHIAAYCGEEAMARLLLAHGAPAGEKNRFECSPLHYAAYMAHESLTKLLLENSVDANSGDYFGSTPLHFATDSGNETVVKLLLDHRADVHAQAKHRCWAERTIGEEGGIAALWLFEDEQDSFLRREMTKNDGTLRRTNTDMRRNPMVQSSMLEGSVYMFPTITYGGAPINVAAYRGRLEAVRLLLARGADPKSKDSVGAPAFWRAAFGGHDAIVALLHEHGVDVNTKDEGTEDPYGPWIADQGLTKSLHGTALSRAAWQGHLSTVRLLLSLGAKTELKDSNGATVLHMAATQHTTENADIVKALLEYGAIIDAKDGEACTSLLRAAYARNPAIVEALLAAGADVQATKDGATAFHMIVSSEEEACYNDYHDPSSCDHCKGGEKVLHIFLNRGVDIDARDDEGMTALFYAVLDGHAIIASQLIDHGADLEVKDKAGLPVLHKAVEDGHVDTVRWLCEKGLNLEALDDEGFTALYSAIDTQNVAMARLLVEKGANVNGLNPELETPLAAAMRHGPAAIAHLLLSNDIDIPNREDALRDAVGRGKEDAVKFLLENGSRGISPVNYRLPKAPSKGYPAIEEQAVNSSQGAKDIVIEIREDGRKEGNDEEDAKEDDEKVEDSAAVIAVCGDKENILKLLLAHNAYDEGDKLLYFALSTGHNHLAEILLNHGISIEVRNKSGCTALHITAAYGEVDAMRWLLSHGADLKAEQVVDCSDDGPTPLFWAANNGHIEALKILLDAYNPYETECGREAEWALKAAAVNGYTDAVTLLLDHGADVEKKFEAGGTTLYWAASCGQEAVVRLLVERGADPGAVDEDGFTAAYWATHHGHNQVSALLDRSEKKTLTASDVSINAK